MYFKYTLKKIGHNYCSHHVLAWRLIKHWLFREKALKGMVWKSHRYAQGRATVVLTWKLMITIILDLRGLSYSLVVGTVNYTCRVLFCTGVRFVKVSAENLAGIRGHRCLSSCLLKWPGFFYLSNKYVCLLWRFVSARREGWKISMD